MNTRDLFYEIIFKKIELYQVGLFQKKNSTTINRQNFTNKKKIIQV